MPGRLTTAMLEAEADGLRRLRDALLAEVRDRAAFADMMTACFVHADLERRALSDDLGVSFSTVFRWAEGRSVPHPSLWPTVRTWVVGSLDGRIGRTEAALAA